jgi:CheY-like chemotaxis protein
MADATPAERCRVMLRAELTHRARTIVAHAFEISEAAVFVRTPEALPIGDLVTVRLSFPNVVDVLERMARVGALRGGAGPGDEPSLALDFVFRSDDERDDLATLVGRMRRPADGRGSYRVLLVEDNLLIRDMFAYGLRKYFDGSGHQVQIDHAADGRQALQMLTDASYDLAIVDYYLPVLDGAGLLAHVRREPRLAGLPVVAISIGGAEAREATLAAGADLFVDKPLVLRDLFSLLERLAPAER